MSLVSQEATLHLISEYICHNSHHVVPLSLLLSWCKNGLATRRKTERLLCATHYTI